MHCPIAEEILPPIRVINYEKFKSLGEFPRYPECKEIVEHLDEIDQDNSFLIFISHCWLAGYNGSPQWRGHPHPDNLGNEKYKLTVNAIKRAKVALAPFMKNCYVWCDFGCIDQSKDPAGELKQLNKIVESMDCLLTPIIDEDYDKWDLKDVHRGMFIAYEAANWNKGDYAYINRAWCRMELFYAAFVTIRADSNERASKFVGGLRYACSIGRRPHILYGTREDKLNKSLKIIEPLQHSLLEAYSPLKGTITVKTDYQKIEELMNQLKPYIQPYKVGYTGDTDENSKFHGHGRYNYEDGACYIGNWNLGKCHGYGQKILNNGSSYTGFWSYNKKHGKGKFNWANGDEYIGEYKENHRTGYGLSKNYNGDGTIFLYSGMFYRDKRHGKGKGILIHSDKEHIHDLEKLVEHYMNCNEAIQAQDGYWKSDEFVNDEFVATPDETRSVDTNKLIEEEVVVKECIFFKQGSCRNGDLCKFLHKNSTGTGSINHDNTILAAKECIFYKQGNCKNGDSCKFIHSIGDAGTFHSNVNNVVIVQKETNSCGCIIM